MENQVVLFDKPSLSLHDQNVLTCTQVLNNLILKIYETYNITILILEMKKVKLLRFCNFSRPYISKFSK
jgi:hypothetical protein